MSDSFQMLFFAEEIRQTDRKKTDKNQMHNMNQMNQIKKIYGRMESTFAYFMIPHM